MNQVLTRERVEPKITVTFSEREALLLRLFLNLVERNHAPSGILKFDIQSLREKLSLKGEQIHEAPGFKD